MDYKMRSFKDLSITKKFIFWFLLISLVPLSISIYVSYNSARKVLKEEVANGLLAIADNKANQIETYLLRQKKEGAALAYTPEVISAVKKLTGVLRQSAMYSQEYNAVQDEFKPMFTYYQKSFDYDDILLVNPDGDIVFSVEKIKEIKSLYETAMTGDSELANVFIKAKESQETEISNFEYNPTQKKATVFIATPIFDAAQFVGVLVVRLSNDGINGFVQEHSGLGNTGETIIVSKIKDEAVFITPVRFDPEATFTRKIKLGSPEGLDIQKALQAEKGLGIYRDYRSKEVLAVRRYLPTFRLGMVVKMDTKEVFVSADRLRNNLLRISLILLIVVAVVAVIIARSVSRPIQELTETSKTISSGNFSARAKINANDEIGELAASFNQMTDSLVEAKAVVEQKKSEVEEQKRLLEEVNKELDSFVYTVSHDLRAPLRGIDGLAFLFEQDCMHKLDEQGKEYLTKIRASARRMQELIDDLLTLSRVIRIKNPYEDADTGALVKSVINRIEFDIKQQKVELEIAQNLPRVRCDRIKMVEVFFNLISNAIKFSSKGKDVTPKVKIGYNDRADAYEFYVQDNGIGIDKKHHTEIFAIFRRLHKQDEYEGTGAGLAIVKRIIDDHRGSIWVDSELGKGATFYFTIPKRLQERIEIKLDAV